MTLLKKYLIENLKLCKYLNFMFLWQRLQKQKVKYNIKP